MSGGSSILARTNAAAASGAQIDKIVLRDLPSASQPVRHTLHRVDESVLRDRDVVDLLERGVDHAEIDGELQVTDDGAVGATEESEALDQSGGM